IVELSLNLPPISFASFGRYEIQLFADEVYIGRATITPRSREFSVEEHSTVQLDPAQDLGECIHSVLRTFCKVRWPRRKVISTGKPSEQIMATLGHGRISRPVAQL